MYAVVKTGGKQYRVCPDDTLRVERLPGEVVEAGSPTLNVICHCFEMRQTEKLIVKFADVLEERGAKGVVLAGFMRILAPTFLDRFPQRVLNIHPSLLPAFPGAHAVENALDHGVESTGVTVHFVDEKVDHGPIVEQVVVPVETGDTTDSLHARIQVEEHRLYPRVVEAFVSGRLFIEDGEVNWL